MTQLTTKAQLAIAALLALIVMHTIMLLALFSGVDPKPPAVLGPFIGASLAAGLFTIPLLLGQNRYRVASVILFILMALPSVGPQKFILEEDALILSPIIILGTGCLLLLGSYVVSERKSSSEMPSRFPDEKSSLATTSK